MGGYFILFYLFTGIWILEGGTVAACLIVRNIYAGTGSPIG